MTFEPYTVCWVLWAKTPEDAISIDKEVDRIFSQWSFYPEVEWARYGYRPPENCAVLGAWRNPQGSTFAFLVEHQFSSGAAAKKQVLLYVAGAKNEVLVFDEQVNALKTGVERAERKELRARNVSLRLEAAEKSASLGRLLKLVGVFTVIVNAFSLYLRSLAPPTLPNRALTLAYESLLGAVHFAALLLLLFVILICIGYVLRYGILLVKRL